jgi:hypothetical protein
MPVIRCLCLRDLPALVQSLYYVRRQRSSLHKGKIGVKLSETTCANNNATNSDVNTVEMSGVLSYTHSFPP